MLANQDQKATRVTRAILEQPVLKVSKEKLDHKEKKATLAYNNKVAKIENEKRQQAETAIFASDIYQRLQECLNSEESLDLCNYLLARYLEAQIEFRTCKFCGKYFGVRKGSKDKYCDRLIGATGKTCKQSGSFRNYEKQYFDNPVNKEYKRAYKTRNARVHAGTMTREEFDAWTKEAKAKRTACLQEKITLDEFIAWLDRDKRRTMD